MSRRLSFCTMKRVVVSGSIVSSSRRFKPQKGSFGTDILFPVRIFSSDARRYPSESVIDKNVHVKESWCFKGHYIGSWEKNVKQGHGILKYNNGFVYEGEFSNDLPHGQGKLTLRNGEVLEGVFVNGELQGHEKIPEFGWSKVTLKNGYIVEGDFTFISGDQTMFCGHGRVTDGTVVEEGLYFNGRLHFMTKKISDKGVAEFWFDSKGRRYARYRFPFGDVWEGWEVNGMAYGTTTITLPSGIVMTGESYRNEMCGEWTSKHPNGKITTEVFSLSYVGRIRRWWDNQK